MALHCLINLVSLHALTSQASSVKDLGVSQVFSNAEFQAAGNMETTHSTAI